MMSEGPDIIVESTTENAAFLPDPTRDGTPGRKNDVMDALGYLFAVFSIYSLRIPLLPFLWNGAGLECFVPVVSPVYREGHHWQAPHRRTAILLHICFGIAMLILGLFQADKTFRRDHLSWHRWCGRAYVVCGLVTIGSLQVLQETVGAGSGTAPSLVMIWFVNLTSCGWMAATLCGVIAARSGRIEMHRTSMRLSLCLAATPILQRMFSWVFMAPLGMAARLIVCAAGATSAKDEDVGWRSFTSIRWGAANDTLTGLGCVLSSSVQGSHEQPFVLSANGYGEGEQLTFGVSAWLGLGTMLIVGLHPLFTTPEDAACMQSTVSDVRMLDFSRRVSRLQMDFFKRHTEHKSWVVKCFFVVGLLSLAAVAAFSAALGVALLTLALTINILIVSLSGAALCIGGFHIGKFAFRFVLQIGTLLINWLI